MELLLVVVLCLACFFFRKKRKEKQQKSAVTVTFETYENIGGELRQTDVHEITVKKDPKKKPVVKDMNHLTADGELPWGWLYANKEFVDQIKDEYSYFMHLWHEAQNKDVASQYAGLKSFVQYIEDVQNLCAKKGECYVKWLNDVVIDHDYYAECKAKLEHIVEHKEELFKQEKKLKKLKKDLLAIIESEPGVIQEKLYKRFDPELKTDISHILYGLWTQGTIRRDKAGRSYALYLN